MLLSALVHRSNAFTLGKKICLKLKELYQDNNLKYLFKQQLVPKLVARETIKALRKDVTAKCYGGDITRKRKLLEKQKAGKKRMRQVGRVEVPQEAFLAVLKIRLEKGPHLHTSCVYGSIIPQTFFHYKK